MHTLRHTTSKESRPTIGYLAYGIHDHIGSTIWAGMAEAAAQRNVLYDLVASNNVDGLVISSGIPGLFVSTEEVQDFCNCYRHLPLVSIAAEL